MLLAIDTSAGTSVALVDLGVGVLVERSSDDPRGHAETIGELISACLADCGAGPSTLSGVVAGMGPGPFTGLRVGIAAARAFAFGAGIPFLPAVSHDAVAFGIDGPALVVTDARRGEQFWSAYAAPDAAGLPVRIHGPALAKTAELSTTVPGFEGYRLIEARTVSAGALGLLAQALLDHGRRLIDCFDGPPGPLYLRSPDVTLSAGPKRVTG